MPQRLRIDRGFTIGAGAVQCWTWNWHGEPDADRGPVLFVADPKDVPPQRVVLVTYDIAKCRAGPNELYPSEVFYEFKIRNDSNITVAFRLEIVLLDDLPVRDTA
ncbi:MULTISPECIES: hypothetical protein [Rhodococcus]|uniref:hypothetical protein n=1 Tax=Rhodococcus TaxID=1827 RepID=UPI00082A01FC|nr:hypothetical protein [Rhodococcus phenolicus]